ncbi:topoisomerase [Halobacillus sp. Cin3]|uniref:topoisomerase n=1 Tax=Halobacillus sp. Cin3 TaxID=2928441 RepID=UPI00248D8D0D|nr:topoisomerase [Halobacillus sp. Cin3]
MNREEVETYFRNHQQEALRRTNELMKSHFGRVYSNFNGLIGGKFRTYGVDVGDCDTAEECVEAWLEGNEKIYQREKNQSDKSSYRIKLMLQDEYLRKFIENFVAKAYFKNK